MVFETGFLQLIYIFLIMLFAIYVVNKELPLILIGVLNIVSIVVLGSYILTDPQIEYVGMMVLFAGNAVYAGLKRGVISV